MSEAIGEALGNSASAMSRAKIPKMTKS